MAEQNALMAIVSSC